MIGNVLGVSTYIIYQVYSAFDKRVVCFYSMCVLLLLLKHSSVAGAGAVLLVLVRVLLLLLVPVLVLVVVLLRVLLALKVLKHVLRFGLYWPHDPCLLASAALPVCRPREAQSH